MSIFVFKIIGNNYHSWALNKVIDYIPDIESFEQICAIIKGLLRSEQPQKYGYHWSRPI